jgi:hypothetical protein
MPIFTMQLFRPFRFCSTRRLLQGVLFFPSRPFGCGHQKIRSTQTSFSPPAASETTAEGAMQAAGFDKFFLHDDCTGNTLPNPTLASMIGTTSNHSRLAEKLEPYTT